MFPQRLPRDLRLKTSAATTHIQFAEHSKEASVCAEGQKRGLPFSVLFHLKGFPLQDEKKTCANIESGVTVEQVCL